MKACTEATLSAGKGVPFPGPVCEVNDITPKPMTIASAETQPNVITGSRFPDRLK
jgi:hypothetical protein